MARFTFHQIDRFIMLVIRIGQIEYDQLICPFVTVLLCKPDHIV